MVRCYNISVVIPTSNRAEDVRRCLESLVSVEYPCWELIVIDQSDNGATREVVRSFEPVLPKLRYYHVSWQNASHARNYGIKVASGDVLGFLDDDCVVPSDWLAQAAGALERHPQAAHIFGELRVPEGMTTWSAQGWVPTRTFAVEREVHVLGNIANRVRLPDFVGNGACVFVRRESTHRVGHFDVHLGGGSRFQTAEDGEYAYRALMAGYSIVGTPHVCVYHHGIRPIAGGEASRLARAYQYGLGAWYMKALRMRDPFALIWIVVGLARYISEISPRALVLGGGPKGVAASIMFMLGMVRSFELKVDHRHRTYAARTVRLRRGYRS